MSLWGYDYAVMKHKKEKEKREPYETIQHIIKEVTIYIYLSLHVINHVSDVSLYTCIRSVKPCIKIHILLALFIHNELILSWIIIAC